MVTIGRLTSSLFIGGVIFLLLSAQPRGAESLQPDLPAGDDSYSHLGSQIQRRLAEMEWGGGKVAIFIEDAQSPVRIYAQNENTLMEPGPLMQIVTAAASLERLGPDFHFTTSLAIAGKVEDKQLSGSLIARSDGDPSVSALFAKDPREAWRLFDRWARLLRKKGIKSVRGMVIGDGRAFDRAWQAPGWPTKHLGSPDLPSVSALNFNHNCIDIFWQKSRKIGAPAPYEIFPDLPKTIFFANSVRIVDEANAPFKKGRTIERNPEGNLIGAQGDLARKTKAHDRAAIEDPARYFAEALKARLIERKVQVEGPPVSAFELLPHQIPEEAKILDIQISPPLTQLLSQMMRHDLTLHAEVILKAMGRKMTGRPGTFGSGAAAVEDFLEQRHLSGSLRKIMDGSGRSGYDRLAAAQLVQVIRLMSRHAAAKDFESLFPRAWEEGILANRFRSFEATLQADDRTGKRRKSEETAKSGKGLEAPGVWAKSSSTEAAEGLAGWAKTRAGRRLAFAMIVNGSKTPPAVLRGQLDTLALELTRAEIEK